MSIFLEEGFIFNVSFLWGGGCIVVVPRDINYRVVIALFYTLQLKQMLQDPLCDIENCETLNFWENLFDSEAVKLRTTRV